MLIPGAIYRFNRTDKLRYYRAARTQAGVDFLYPISVDGSRIADKHKSGRRYVILYFMTRWEKLAASGYWLDPKKAFEQAYVTDATLEDLDLVAPDLETLPLVDDHLDNILNRLDIELDMEVWGSLLDR
jgi:hypothetical protein